MSETLKNYEKVIQHLEEIEDMDLEKALTKACLLVETSAKENCPVDDGTLRGSIRSDVNKVEKVGTVGTNLEYAPYVHQGTGIYASGGGGRQDGWSYQDAEGEWHFTRGQKPNPFLTKALHTNKQKIMEIFKKEMREKIDG